MSLSSGIRIVIVVLCCLCIGTTADAQSRRHRKHQSDTGILWRKFVTREADLRQWADTPLLHMTDSSGNHAGIFKVMVDAIHGGEVSVRDTSGKDTLIVGDQVLHDLLDMSKAYDLVIHEEWFFDADSGMMRVKILFLGPCSRGSTKPLFYVPYTELAPTLNKYWLGTPPVSCFSYFEDRKFASRITAVSPPYQKVDTNNPSRDEWVY